MLKKDVRDAVEQKKFHIWAVDHVNDGIELLTGVKAGAISEEGTVHHLVNKTLLDFAQKMKAEQEDETIKPNDQQKWVSSVV
jgi:predicted ATP-dependent protease